MEPPPPDLQPLTPPGPWTVIIFSKANQLGEWCVVMKCCRCGAVRQTGYAGHVNNMLARGYESKKLSLSRESP